jgi:hypothetical protein
MSGPVPGGWSAAEQEEIWARWRRGESLRTVARHFRRDMAYVRRLLASTGGRRLPPRSRAAGQLTAAEREEVSRGLAAGVSHRRIAAGLGRSHTTIVRDDLARGSAQWRAHAVAGQGRGGRSMGAGPAAQAGGARGAPGTARGRGGEAAAALVAGADRALAPARLPRRSEHACVARGHLPLAVRAVARRAQARADQAAAHAPA